MKLTLRNFVVHAVKKDKLFERSEFLSFRQGLQNFSQFHTALTFFVTFFCQDKKVSPRQAAIKLVENQ